MGLTKRVNKLQNKKKTNKEKLFIEQRWIDKDAERKKDKQKIKILDKQITKKKGGGSKERKKSPII